MIHIGKILLALAIFLWVAYLLDSTSKHGQLASSAFLALAVAAGAVLLFTVSLP